MENDSALDEACAAVSRDPNPAYIKDSELRYIAVNEAYAALWDSVPGHLVGRKSHQHFDAIEHNDRDEKERRSLVFGKDQTALFAHPLKSRRFRIRISRHRRADNRPFIACHFEPIAGVRFEESAGAETPEKAVGKTGYASFKTDANAGLRGDFALLKSAIEQSSFPISVEDAGGRKIAASSSYRNDLPDLTETALPHGGWLRLALPQPASQVAPPAIRPAADDVEARLHEAFDKLDVGIILYGPEERLVYANPALHELTRGAYEMRPGMTLREVIEASWIGEGDFEERFAAHHDYGKAFLAAIGNGRTLRIVNQRLVDGSMLGVRIDVSDLAAREEALKAKELENSLFRAALDTLPIPTFIKDEAFRYVFVNQSLAKTAKTEAVKMVGKSDFEIFGDQSTAIRESDEDVMRSGEAKEVELSLTRPNGDLILLSRKTRFNAPDGQNFLLGSTMNITPLKKRESELLDARRRAEEAGALLSTAAGAMAQGLFIVVNGKVQFVNETFKDMVQVPAELLEPGRDWRDYVAYCAERGDFDATGRERTRAKIIADAESGVAYSSERRLVDGRWVKIDALPTDDGKLIVTYTDVTEAHGRQEELEQLVRKVEAADRAKSEFLANMSHEIRTPMNGVLGMAELLSRTELDGRQKTFTDIIVKSGSALLTIINDILDFSKIDAGQMVLDPAPFDLRETVEDVATLVSSRAIEKDVELIVRIDPALEPRVVGDAGRVRQVLTNIVGNAVKFTEIGHVLIEMSGQRTADDRFDLAIRVEDTGIGIPADKLDTVFEKFSQVDTSSTRRHEGTGLGLAITAKLVELMGGTISADSEYGKGSVFTVELSLPADGEVQRARPMPVDVTGARVLVIDDNAVNRQILSEQLSAWGFDGCAAESGDEGEQVLDAAAAHGLSVDAIVLDYHMPGRNGIEVARSIRRKHPAAELPIIMLTSMDIKSAEPGLHEIGVQATLMKPARSSLLLETIIEVIQDATRWKRSVQGVPPLSPDHLAPFDDARSDGEVTATVVSDAWIDEMHDKHARGQAPEDGAAGGAGSLDILVAEDNEVNQIVFTQILEQMDLRYLIVDNGQAAVDAWTSLDPTLILMDVSMPVMNGHEAAAEIRRLEEEGLGTRRTPIIGVTAHALTGDRDRCLAAGMDDYLSKPISPDKLEEKIRNWLPPEVRERIVRVG